LGLAAKRLFDFVAGSLLLILTLPLLLAASIAILLTIGWPVLFKQRRCGRGEKAFLLYKLRTLTEERDAQNQFLPDEERLTTIGRILRRTSVDELPELWNVLKGKMSLVGPRPLLVAYLPSFNSRQRLRHKMRPGITGWAQVNGRNALSWKEKLELDAWYVEHWSIWLDLRILVRTVVIVFKQEGINQPGHATAAKFTPEGPHSGGDRN
jgi:lipopolysaccharide/colanic/teichoic acid biosynthesis glycosyltransferase